MSAIASNDDGSAQTLNDGSHLSDAWPDRLGTLRHDVRFDSPFRIFKIEDAQFGMDVQDGMVDVLTFLATTLKLRLVCLEGASGEIRSEELKAMLEPGEEDRVRAEFRQRHISAPEYLALATDLPLRLFGAENPEQYRMNTEALIQAHLSGRATDSLFEIMERQVAVLTANLCNPRLQHFEKSLAAYDRRELGLGELVQDVVLPSLSRLDSAANTLPDLQKFSSLLALEKQIDFRKVRLETRRLLGLLLAQLRAPRIDRALFERSVKAQLRFERAQQTWDVEELRSGELQVFRRFTQRVEGHLRQLALRTREGHLKASETHLAIVDLAVHLQVDVRKFPNFLRYSHYIYKTSRLSRTGLLDQLQRAEELVRESLVENELERNVTRAARAVSGTRRLCQLEMTPDAADRLTVEFGQLSSLDLFSQLSVGDCRLPEQELVHWARKVSAELDATGASPLELLEKAQSLLVGASPGPNEIARLALLGFEVALEGAYRFYQLAPLRGRTLAENTLRAMREYDVSDAILISGGFLTEQILAVLTRESITHSVIIPRSEETQMDRTTYFDRISNAEEGSSFINELWQRAGVAGPDREP